jgi:predicted site-specific integrase-resolvase
VSRVASSTAARPRSNLAEPDEVAEFLKVSPRTLAQWRWRKIGPPWTKVGGRVRYRWEAVDAYVASREAA